ncbi:MAG TPA: pyridoxal-dependent decarboxylase, exosortase A system-associated [Aliidongia sp.]|uniref:pyridoxal-dependent decarboxylase, exosortase A system-associated n=1 Tax=Aliidongia sp. TaxID=1914230 RepID=UPI002DDD3623|nr:pyridoxal-dependent decarboxylase, exosortase A system-associated [Aliidongia sp.]HEV2676392.1 pyridoxal-dependent decarboxylase, exosortase A system-associated [Aliidongia sp.]
MSDAGKRPALPADWQSSVEGGELRIGGIPVRRLAERVGATPFFAYDRARITQRVTELRRALPATIDLHYSLKANPMPALVGHLAGLVDGFDVASAGEMKIALDAGMASGRIDFAGPGKSDAELRQAAAAGIVISLEGQGEPERLHAAGLAVGCRPKVLVRVNPAFDVRAGGLRMGGGAKAFGIDEEDVPAVLQRIAALDLDLEGFHLYWGSQSLDAARIADAQEQAVSAFLKLADLAPTPPRLFNLGGGFGIPYAIGDAPLDMAAAAGSVAAGAARLTQRLPDARLILELGRYLVGEAGVYVCRVLDRKVSRGEVFLVTDGGLHHHLAASGNFGQVVRRNYPVAIATRMADGPSETATIAGRLCTPLDVLARKAELAVAQAGDLVAVFQSGAYGASASPAGFLSHGAAPEILV